MFRAIALVSGAVFLTTEAKSEDLKVPTLDEMVGKYRYAGDRNKDESTILAKIKTATAEMNFLMIRIAKPRLEISTSFPKRMTISRSGGKAIFAMDDYVVTLPEDGTREDQNEVERIGRHLLRRRKSDDLRKRRENRGHQEQFFSHQRGGAIGNGSSCQQQQASCTHCVLRAVRTK